jgi:hypothetical protein
VGEVFTDIYGESPAAPLTTRSLKVTPPLRSIIQNTEEVLQAFRETEHLAMIEEALS